MIGRVSEPGNAPQRVILAYAEAIVRKALADHLRSCGYDVIDAATSDEAMAALSEATGADDTLLCDIAIPGSVSGFSLSIEARDRGLRVVLTGSLPGAVEAAVEMCQRGPQPSGGGDAAALVDWIRRELAHRAARVT
jgi:DNA-binding NtrC family response regulator